MSKIDNVFVINLKNNTERWKTINDKFKNTGLKLIRWDAVYGKDMTEQEIYDNTTTLCNLFCSPGMIGCSMSHITLWKHIVANNLDNVLILEDDAYPADDSFTKDLNKALQNIPSDYDVIYLGYTFLQDKDLIIDGKKSEYYTIVKSERGTHAYMLSNKGAKKLLESKDFQKISYHIDCSLSYYIYDNPDLKAYALTKRLIIQDAKSDTSNIMDNAHPIPNLLLSQYCIMNGVSLEAITNAQIIYIRRLGIAITFYIFFFMILSFLIGLYGSNTLIKYYFAVVIGMNIIELGMRNKNDYNTIGFELGLIALMTYSGYKCRSKN